MNHAILTEAERRPGISSLGYGRLDLTRELRRALRAVPFFVKGSRWQSVPPAHLSTPRPAPSELRKRRWKVQAWNDFNRLRFLELDREFIFRDDVVIFHSLETSCAGSIGTWLRSRSGEDAPTAVIYFANPIHRDPDGGFNEQAVALFDGVAAYPPERVIVLAETREMRNDFMRMSGMRNRVELAPLYCSPYISSNLLEDRAKRVGDAPPCVGYVGYWRFDRGSHLVPQIIAEVARQNGEVHFRVHVQNPPSHLFDSRPIAEMPRIDLREGNLPIGEYYRYLANIDIMLFPYEPGPKTDYQGSGIFLESLALGLVTVIPRESFLAREAERMGAGFVSYERWTPESIASATLEAAKSFERLEARSRAAAARFRTERSLSAFMDRVLEPERT